MSDSPSTIGSLSSISEAALSELRQALGEACLTSEEARSQHAGDVSRHRPRSPELVLMPATVQDVSKVLEICDRHRVPVVPFGTGTGVEGGTVPVGPAVSVSTTRMKAVLEVNEVDEYAVVQAGVTRLQLNAELDQRGSHLFFPIDPGADASIGGMASTNASGSAAVLYGAMRQNVLALEAVLADGTVFRSGTRARKSSAGFDLTRLLVGAEGTLAVITEVTVRLSRRPESLSAATCQFDSVEAAIEAVLNVKQAGIPMARIELLDELQIEAVRRYSGLPIAARPSLFFEFQGREADVSRHACDVGQIVRDSGGTAFQWAVDEQRRRELWQARYDCYYAALALRENAIGYVTDVCVPLSELAACITRTRELLRDSPVPAPLLGHVGDGNFHVLFVLDPDAPEELAKARRIGDQIVRFALEHGGTCTGEHGVGLGKLGLLELEAGPGLEVMRRIKQALDPHGILNPGKVLSVAE